MDTGDLRDAIDQIDKEMLLLLNRRFECAVQVRKLKSSTAAPERELQVIEGVRAGSRNLLDPNFVQGLFETIIEESKAQQDRGLPLIGFQGEHGAYSEVAASRFLPQGAQIPCSEFRDVVDAVRTGVLDYGVLPVENSVAGSVDPALDLLVSPDFQLSVIGEVAVPVHHCLLTLPEADYKSIRQVLSHPQALAQCRGFLSRNNLDPRPYYDTAGAAKMLAKDRPTGTAVIASSLCAELYGLSILKENIEDDARNTTRFFVLSAKADQSAEGTKCSIVFSLRHEPGALSEAIQILASGKMNLTRIESRPVAARPGEFAFLVDFLGNPNQTAIARGLEELQRRVTSYRFLGCYVAAGTDVRS